MFYLQNLRTPTERTVEKVETAKQLRVGMKTTAPCRKVMPLFDNMTDFNGWTIVIQARSHQFLAGFLPPFAEKKFVHIGINIPLFVLNQK